MGVEAVHIESVTPYADLRYELVRGTVDFAVDPEHPANRSIVDLDRAPRGADGLVRFDADLRILRPVDGGSGDLLFVVPNRGLLGGAPFSTGTVVDYADLERVDPGDGFLLDRGWTIVWCGWQWDVRRGPGNLGITVPEADVPPGRMRVEWRSDTDEKRHLLSDTMPGLGAFFRFDTYPTADIGDPEAVLAVRTSPDGEWSEIPRDSWHFTDATHIALAGGFRAFHWYELVYRTSRAPVVGCGLLAIRDIVSHLRSEGVQRTFGFGISQSGRLLRQFLWDGLNLDESGTRVFDGVFAHVAAGARGEFNHRYAQPSLTGVDGFAGLPPFDGSGLLARQRDSGGVPKVVLTNSASEYWRGDGSLVHVDPVTGADLPEDPDVRVYALAGTDHMGPNPIKGVLPGVNPTHKLDPQPVLRALLIALRQWVIGEEAAPPSRVPRVADGTAVPAAKVLDRFGHVPHPNPDLLPRPRRLDLGPEADRGVGRWPVRRGDPYIGLVSMVDDDGNELAGIRLPAVAAPLASYTGWNPRRHVDHLPDVLYERLGSKLPFPPGRPTVADRYPTRAAYAAAVREAANALVSERLLLAGDVEAVVGQAVADY
ncbi:alpha/beta hydrolase domain-containing protein [Nocardia sp. NPDC051570]|uniref:alpha/beta hydrolase domain-containing protein n=1 Tax=Nocardia sp. NPDC051570 TaxID=3364324 RepID=UPI00378E175E